MTHIPRVGILIGHHAFDLSISKSRREVNHLFLLIFTVIFCSPPLPGLDIDKCINKKLEKKGELNEKTKWGKNENRSKR